MKTREDRAIKVSGETQTRNSRSIELHIGELVLHGFSHAERRPIVESIERELRTLITSHDFSGAASFQVDRMNAQPFALEGAGRSDSAGVNIARAIYGGLRQ